MMVDVRVGEWVEVRKVIEAKWKGEKRRCRGKMEGLIRQSANEEENGEKDWWW